MNESIRELYDYVQAKADEALVENTFAEWSAYFLVADKMATLFPFLLNDAAPRERRALEV